MTTDTTTITVHGRHSTFSVEMTNHGERGIATMPATLPGWDLIAAWDAIESAGWATPDPNLIEYLDAESVVIDGSDVPVVTQRMRLHLA